MEDWPGGPRTQTPAGGAWPVGGSVSDVDPGELCGVRESRLPSATLREMHCCYWGEEVLLGYPSGPQIEVRKPEEADFQEEVNTFFQHLHLAEPNMESPGKTEMYTILAPASQGQF